MRFLLWALALNFSSMAMGAFRAYPTPTPNRCTLQVLFELAKDGLSEEQAVDICEPFSDFCVVRKYDTNRFEAHLRFKKLFEAKTVRDVLDDFTRFLRRSRFVQDDIDVSLQFFNCGG